MRQLTAWTPKAVATTLLLAALSPASGALYTLEPGSSLQLSGTLAIDVGGVASSSSVLLEQAPGSLSAALTGSLNADANGAALNFPGQSAITLVDSGTWLPSGLPAAFAMQAEWTFMGPGGSATLRFIGAVRNVTFDLTGTAPLSGPVGNQTFDAGGLQLATLTGTWDGEVTCIPDCGTNPFNLDLGEPPADVLGPGVGSHSISGAAQTLSFPIVVSSSDTQTEIVDGIPITFSGTLLLQGSIAASAPIPEPSTWALLFVGMLGIFFAWLRGRGASIGTPARRAAGPGAA